VRPVGNEARRIWKGIDATEELNAAMKQTNDEQGEGEVRLQPLLRLAQRPPRLPAAST
jgi:hypothetical protein